MAGVEACCATYARDLSTLKEFLATLAAKHAPFGAALERVEGVVAAVGGLRQDVVGNLRPLFEAHLQYAATFVSMANMVDQLPVFDESEAAVTLGAGTCHDWSLSDFLTEPVLWLVKLADVLLADPDTVDAADSCLEGARRVLATVSSDWLAWLRGVGVAVGDAEVCFTTHTGSLPTSYLLSRCRVFVLTEQVVVTNGTSVVSATPLHDVTFSVVGGQGPGCTLKVRVTGKPFLPVTMVRRPFGEAALEVLELLKVGTPDLETASRVHAACRTDVVSECMADAEADRESIVLRLVNDPPTSIFDDCPWATDADLDAAWRHVVTTSADCGTVIGGTLSKKGGGLMSRKSVSVHVALRLTTLSTSAVAGSFDVWESESGPASGAAAESHPAASLSRVTTDISRVSVWFGSTKVSFLAASEAEARRWALYLSCFRHFLKLVLAMSFTRAASRTSVSRSPTPRASRVAPPRPSRVASTPPPPSASAAAVAPAPAPSPALKATAPPPARPRATEPSSGGIIIRWVDVHTLTPQDFLAAHPYSDECEQVLGMYAMRGMREQAATLLDAMAAAGLLVSPVAHTAIIAASCRRGELSTAEGWFDGVPSSGRTADMAMPLLETYAERGLAVKADALLAVMMAAGGKQQPSAEHFHLLIDAYGVAGCAVAAEGVPERMADHGVAPCVDTYNRLIVALGRCQLPNRALQLHATMSLVGTATPAGGQVPPNLCAPNDATLSAVIHAVATAGWWREAMQALTVAVTNQVATVEPAAYAAVLDAAAVAAAEEPFAVGEAVEDVLRLVASLEIELGDLPAALRASLIRCHGALGNSDQVRTEFDHANTGAAGDDVHVTNAAVVALSACGDVASWRRLRTSLLSTDSTPHPNTASFNALIAAHGCHGDRAPVPALVTAMATGKVSPDLGTVEALVSVYARGADWGSATSLLHSLPDSAGKRLHGVAAAHAAHCLAKGGRLTDAVELVDQLSAELAGGRVPDGAVGGFRLVDALAAARLAVIEAMLDAGDVMRAGVVLGKLVGEASAGAAAASTSSTKWCFDVAVDAPPGARAHALSAFRQVLAALAADGSMEALRSTFAQHLPVLQRLAVAAPPPISLVVPLPAGAAPTPTLADVQALAATQAFDALIDAYASCRRPDLVPGVLDAMRADGVLPQPSTVAALARCYATCGVVPDIPRAVQDAVTVAAALRAPLSHVAELQAGVEVGCALMEAYASEGLGGEVQAVWAAMEHLAVGLRDFLKARSGPSAPAHVSPAVGSPQRKGGEPNEGPGRLPPGAHTVHVEALAACLGRGGARLPSGGVLHPGGTVNWKSVEAGLGHLRDAVCGMAAAGHVPGPAVLGAVCCAYANCGLGADGRLLMRIALTAWGGKKYTAGDCNADDGVDLQVEAAQAPGGIPSDTLAGLQTATSSRRGGHSAVASMGVVGMGQPGSRRRSMMPPTVRVDAEGLAFGAGVWDASKGDVALLLRRALPPVMTQDAVVAVLPALGELGMLVEVSNTVDAMAQRGMCMGRVVASHVFAAYAMCGAAGLAAAVPADARFHWSTADKGRPWGAPRPAPLSQVSGMGKARAQPGGGVGAAVEASLTILAACCVGRVARGLAGVEDALNQGVLPLPDAITAVLESAARLTSLQLCGSPPASSGLLPRVEDLGVRLRSAGWRPRSCDVNALVRLYGRAHSPQVATGLAFALADGGGGDAPALPAVTRWLSARAGGLAIVGTADADTFASLAWALALAPEAAYKATPARWHISPDTLQQLDARMRACGVVPTEAMWRFTDVVSARCGASGESGASGRGPEDPTGGDLAADTAVGTLSRCVARMRAAERGRRAHGGLPPPCLKSLLASVGYGVAGRPHAASVKAWRKRRQRLGAMASPQEGDHVVPAGLEATRLAAPPRRSLPSAVEARGAAPRAARPGGDATPEALEGLETEILGMQVELDTLNQSIADKQAAVEELQQELVLKTSIVQQAAAAQGGMPAADVLDAPVVTRAHHGTRVSLLEAAVADIGGEETSLAATLARKMTARDAYLAFSYTQRKMSKQESSCVTRVITAEKRQEELEVLAAQAAAAEGGVASPLLQSLHLRGFHGVRAAAMPSPTLVHLQSERLLRFAKERNRRERVVQMNHTEATVHATNRLQQRLLARHMERSASVARLAEEYQRLVNDFPRVVAAEKEDLNAVAVLKALVAERGVETRHTLAAAHAYRRRAVARLEELGRKREGDATTLRARSVQRAIESEALEGQAASRRAELEVASALGEVHASVKEKFSSVGDVLARTLSDQLDPILSRAQAKAAAAQSRLESACAEYRRVTGGTVDVEDPGGREGPADLRQPLLDLYEQLDGEPEGLATLFDELWGWVMAQAETRPAAVEQSLHALCTGELLRIHESAPTRLDAHALSLLSSAARVDEPSEDGTASTARGTVASSTTTARTGRSRATRGRAAGVRGRAVRGGRSRKPRSPVASAKPLKAPPAAASLAFYKTSPGAGLGYGDGRRPVPTSLDADATPDFEELMKAGATPKVSLAGMAAIRARLFRVRR